MSTQAIMLELNELSPTLLEQFMAAGDLPNFKRLYDSSIVRTTDSGEEPPYLEPWIQWPTVHFGVPRSQHGAFVLGDARNCPEAGVAKVLSDAGIRVGVFGAMNLNYEMLNGYYLPDPWDAPGRAYPPSLQIFADFVSRQVRDSSKDSTRIGLADAANFLRFLIANGLTFATIGAVVRQLLVERTKPNLRWKRAMLQDNIAYDVFESLNKRFDVAFATFFSNSVAHFQHYHWRDMLPEIFDHPLEEGADESHRDAIREGYVRNDMLVGRVLRSYPKCKIIFATGLSQQPWIETAKCTYRPRDFDAFATFAGLSGVSIEPVMAEEFRVVGGDPETIARALLSLERNQKPVMKVSIVEGAIVAGCDVNDGDTSNLDTIVTGPGGSQRFGELFYRLSAMRSGKHHRSGALWIRDGSPHRVEPQPVALETIAPTILAMFGVAPQPQHVLPLSFSTSEPVPA